jgi:hypothetical protein
MAAGESDPATDGAGRTKNLGEIGSFAGRFSDAGDS